MRYAIQILRLSLAKEERFLRLNEEHARNTKAVLGRRHTPQECSCQRSIRTERRRIAELRAAIERLKG